MTRWLRCIAWALIVAVCGAVGSGCTTVALYGERFEALGGSTPHDYSIKVYCGGGCQAEMVRERATKEAERFMLGHPGLRYRSYRIVRMVPITAPSSYIFTFRFGS
jgi:hypothetical protein